MATIIAPNFVGELRAAESHRVVENFLMELKWKQKAAISLERAQERRQRSRVIAAGCAQA